MAADEDAVDVHRELPTGDRIEAREVAHPTNQQLGFDEVVEHAIGAGRDVDGRAECLAHRFFSISRLSAARCGSQKPWMKSATGANPSRLIAYRRRVPDLCASTRPALSSTARCWDAACCVTSTASAISVTPRGPLCRTRRISTRLGSPSALKALAVRRSESFTSRRLCNTGSGVTPSTSNHL